MKDTVEGRALKIAAKVMQADGLCRHESPQDCRRVYVDDTVCEKCIRAWLIAKAKKELKEEHGKEGRDGRDHKINPAPEL